MSKKGLFSLYIIIAFFAIGCDQTYKKKYEELKLKNELHKENIEALKDSTQVLLDSINNLKELCFYYKHQAEIVEPSYWVDKYDIEALQKLGFKDPQKEILADLQKSSYLFADDGILGGTMQIDAAVLIGTNWVLAMGGDGHIELHYLLEFTVEKNKKIKWKIINKRNIYS